MSVRHLVRIWLALGLVACSPAAPPGAEKRAEAPAVEERTLPRQAGTLVEATLVGGEAHRYRLDLAAGEMADLAVEQQGIDVEVALFRPDGARRRVVDSPNGNAGREPLPLVAGGSGAYRIEVRSPTSGAPAGRYRLELAALRPATEDDRRRSAAEDVLAAAEEARRQGGAGLSHALALYTQADERLAELGESTRRGDVDFYRALSHAAAGALEPAAGSLRRALARFEAAGEDRRAGNALHSLGGIEQRRGATHEAIASYSRALAFHRATAERWSEAATLVELGDAYTSLGEAEEALACFEQALALWRRLGARREEGLTLSSEGWVYLSFGEPRAALDLFLQALPVLRERGERGPLAVVLSRVGAARTALGDPGAVADLEEALALQRQAGDRREEGVMLAYLGFAHRRFGHLEEAGACYRQALALAEELEDPRAEGTVLVNLGWLADARGDAAEAARLFHLALPLSAATGERGAESSARLGLGRALARLGDPDGARESLERAVEGIEAQREEPSSAGLRMSYQASRQSYYEALIGLLMDLDLRRPGQGHNRAALAVAERARARSLLDTLAETGGGVAPSRRRAEVRSRLAHPGYAALALPRPLSVEELQSQVLDDDTLLLEYALGAERSFLWAVTPSTVRSFELPGRAEIEALAREAHTLLAASHRRAARAGAELATAELSRLLLAPAAQLLAGKRLLVVPDGALHYLPFAALPEPDGTAPLLAAHEVVTLPSASALALLRRELGPRPPAPAALAVFADPAFGPDLPRLAFSRQEAAAVLALVPREQALAALGTEANLETVLSGALGRYRLLHFATHGVLDGEHPERTGLVLSQLDREGRPRPGFLGPPEIAGLRLNADLVVLSACQTALGKEVRGEGLVGLTRSFMAAGAERVLVSLWRVDDRATAELMERFYRALLAEGKPAAAALRQAQAELRQVPAWGSPSYWAGFVLQGDWR